MVGYNYLYYTTHTYLLFHRGVVAGLLYAVDNAAYVIAIANTYTINVYLFFAFSPVFIAILSYFINNDLFNFKLVLTTFVCSIGIY